MKQHLKIWEISLLFALCVTLLAGLGAKAEQSRLSSELVRLHVLANSDSDSDQAVKLRVRDAVLNVLTPKLEGAKSLSEAAQIINNALAELEKTAGQTLMQNGKLYSVKAELSTEHYPTRHYDGFSLPEGDYVSLRVILGNGRGHNWWCVVFPPLCISSVEDEDAFSALSNESAKLITAQGGQYRLKFRAIEIYEKVKTALS